MAGEVLMHAIKSCVGPEIYTDTANRGWCKIYSMLLDVIVPEVVHHELRHRTQAQMSLSKRSVMASNSILCFDDEHAHVAGRTLRAAAAATATVATMPLQTPEQSRPASPSSRSHSAEGAASVICSPSAVHVKKI